MRFLNFNLWLITLATAALLAAGAAWIYGKRRRQRLILQLVGKPMSERLTSSVDPRKRRWRAWLFFASLLLVLAAATRPWWGQRLVPTPSRSRDILIIIDCSRSMLAQDVAPSRLRHAKWFVREVAERFPADRFGLVAFAGDAFLECPLTQDRNTLFLFLDDLDTSTIPLGGTNIESALKTANKAFDGAKGTDRAIVLMTDGDELQGNAIAQTKPWQGSNVAFLVVGIGDPAQSSPIQLPDNTFIRDAEGNLVQTRLHQERLQEIAAAAGGLYMRSTAVNPNVDAVASRIDRLIPAEGEKEARLQPVERYQIPLAAALILLIIRMFIGERRNPVNPRPSGAVSMLFILAAVSLCAPPADATAPTAATAAQELTPAVAAPQAPGPADQVERVAEIKAALPEAQGADVPRLHYNLGIAYQELDQLETAVEEYRQVLASPDTPPQLRAWATWNLGVVQHLQARKQVGENNYDAALAKMRSATEYYREALRAMPDTPALANNLELLNIERQRVEKARALMQRLEQQLAAARHRTADALSQQQDANQAATPAEKQSRRQQAAEAGKAAQEAVQSLAQTMRNADLDKGDQFKSIDAAEKALQQAVSEQSKALQQVRSPKVRAEATAKATAELEKAARMLGADKETRNERDQGDGEQQKGKEQPGQPQPNGSSDTEPQQTDTTDAIQQMDQQTETATETPSPATANAEEQPLDRQQARALLLQMQEQEQDLREAIKQYRARQYQQKQVEKNW